MPDNEVYITRSPQETFLRGADVGRSARPGDIYALEGDLGAGKTVFTQGIAEGLGIKDPVNSPTFTILQVYEGGRLPLYHFDAYRLEDPEELAETGYEEYFYGEGVTVIEWASRVEECLPPDCVHITINRDDSSGDSTRLITFSDSRKVKTEDP